MSSYAGTAASSSVPDRQPWSGYVLSYVNPDSDGVGGSIAYSEWARRACSESYTPVRWGALDAATRAALRHYALRAPRVATSLPGDAPVVLLDTHHLTQLPESLDPRQVMEIIDHHPHGDLDAFPNARVQNEVVGAAATLVAERFEAASLLPSPSVAGLLACAIVCSTWNLRAPSTSDRDRQALDRLRTVTDFPAALARELLATLDQAPATFDTLTLLAQNTKRFRFGAQGRPSDTLVVIVQIECSRTAAVTERADLLDAIRATARQEGAEHYLVSVVGLDEGATVIVCPEPGTRTLLERVLNLGFSGVVAREQRLMLRKTDFVPQLAEHFGVLTTPANTKS